MDDATERFFAEGLARFAEARATLDAFESTAKAKIIEIVSKYLRSGEPIQARAR